MRELAVTVSVPKGTRPKVARHSVLYVGDYSGPSLHFDSTADRRAWLLAALTQEMASTIHPPRNERQTWESGVVPSLGYDPFGDSEVER